MSIKSSVRRLLDNEQKDTPRRSPSSTIGNANLSSKGIQTNASRSRLKREVGHIESSPSGPPAKRITQTGAFGHTSQAKSFLRISSKRITTPITSVKKGSEICTASPTPTINGTDDDDSLSSCPSEFQDPFLESDQKSKPAAKTRSNSPENLPSRPRFIGQDSHLGRESKPTQSENTAECNKCHLRGGMIGLRYWCKECVPLEPTEEPILLSVAPIEDPRLQPAISEINGLRMQLAEKTEYPKEEREELSRKEDGISNLTLARDLRGTAELEKCLVVQRKKLNSFQNTMNRRERFGTFTTLSLNSSNRLGIINIEVSLDGMFRQAQQIMCGFEGEFNFNVPALKENNELESLILNLGLEASSVRLATFSPQTLIRALASSALQKWIFETEFPLSNVHAENFRLLKEYREMILIQDGPLALRNLDLAALSSIITAPSDFLAKKVPKLATDLAIRLSQSLAPLFTSVPLSASDLTWDNFATWGQELEVWRDCKARLTEMFTTALEIKARSICNIEDYDFVTFKPGRLYDGEYMDVEAREGMAALGHSKEYEGKRIGVCVQGAVMAVPRVLKNDDGITEAVLTMKNFGSERRDGSTVISKGTVVLEHV